MYISPKKQVFLRAVAWTVLPVLIVFLSSFTYLLTGDQAVKQEAETSRANEAVVDSITAVNRHWEERKDAASKTLKDIRSKVRDYSVEAGEVLAQVQAEEESPESSSSLTTAWSEVEVGIKQAKGQDLFRSDTLFREMLEDLGAYAYSLKQEFERKEMAIRAENVDDLTAGTDAEKLSLCVAQKATLRERLEGNKERLEACEDHTCTPSVDCPARWKEKEQKYLDALNRLAIDVEKARSFIGELNILPGKNRTNRDSAEVKLASISTQVMAAIRHAEPAGQ